MERPLILVTNDDGYQAPGIVALSSALRTVGEVIVVAPERPQSASSQAISLHKPLRIKEVEPGVFFCSGTPTDSVYVALHHVLGRHPDLVASGINHGANLGPDLMYSGTAAAAREAAYAGIPAVAFSLASTAEGLDFTGPAKVAASLCEEVLAEGLCREGEFINVNFPAETTEATPWRLCSLGRRHYSRIVTALEDPRGKPYFWVGGRFLGHDDIPGSDCNAIDAGEISLTAVSLQSISDGGAERIAKLLKQRQENS